MRKYLVLLLLFQIAFNYEGLSQRWEEVQSQHLAELADFGQFLPDLVCRQNGKFYFFAYGKLYENSGGNWTLLSEIANRKFALDDWPCLSKDGNTFVVSTSNELFVSTDHGQSWQSKQLPAEIKWLVHGQFQNGRLYGLMYANQKYQWGYSDDLGTTWAYKDSFTESLFLYKLGDGRLALCRNTFSKSTTKLQYITDTTLKTVPLAGPGYYSYYPLSAGANGRIYSEILDYSSLTYKFSYYEESTNQWKDVSRDLLNPLDQYPLTGIPLEIFADGPNVYVSFYDEVTASFKDFISTNNGASYTGVQTASPGKWSMADYFSFSGNNSLIIEPGKKLHNGLAEKNYQTYISQDQGKTFSSATGMYHANTLVTFSDGNKIYSITQPGELYESTDGINWSKNNTIAFPDKLNYHEVHQGNQAFFVRVDNYESDLPRNKEFLYGNLATPIRFMDNFPAAESANVRPVAVNGADIAMYNYTSKGLYFSSNSGGNWALESANPFFPVELSLYWKLFIHNGKYYFVQGRQLWSKEIGNSAPWEEIIKNEDNLNIDPDNCFAAGDNFYLIDFSGELYNVDLSGSFHSVTNLPKYHSNGSGYSFWVEGNNIYLVESVPYNDPVIHFSRDNGQTWKSRVFEGLLWPAIYQIFKIGNKILVSTETDGLLAVEEIYLDINESGQATSQIIVFPNPSSGQISFREEVKNIQVFSISGIQVMELQGNTENRYDLQGLDAGTFLLRVEKRNGEIGWSNLVIL